MITNEIKHYEIECERDDDGNWYRILGAQFQTQEEAVAEIKRALRLHRGWSYRIIEVVTTRNTVKVLHAQSA